MLPVFLDLTSRLAVVIGGGPVGRRKASAARQAGALVRLVCLEPCPNDLSDNGIDWRCASYEPSQLQEAALVFAAASPEVNEQVVADCTRLGIWVNSASGNGNVDLGAAVRRGDIVISVSTSGAAPGLARQLCNRINEQLPVALSGWTRLLRELRAEILQAGASPETRRRLLLALSDWSWLEQLEQEGAVATRAKMLEWLAKELPS